MSANEFVKELMRKNKISYHDLARLAELGTPSNLHQMLSRKDLKVSVFAKLLEAMDYELLAVDLNDPDNEYVIDD